MDGLLSHIPTRDPCREMFSKVCMLTKIVQHFSSRPALIYIQNDKYEFVQKTFLKENLCALQVSCVHSSHDLCARAA